MERWVGIVAIVTGASVGIGAGITEALVKEGLIVAGFARRKEKVEELAKELQETKGKLHAVKVDIRNEDEIIDGFKWVKKNLGPVHILINNAGILNPTTLVDGDTEIWRDNWDTNVMGLCVATREAVRDMRANNVDGHIININSVAGHKVIVMPALNVYPGSKFAVRALSETLRHEFIHNKLKIKVTNLSPGYVKNGSFEPDPDSPLAKMEPIYPKDIANGVLYVLGTPPHVQIQQLTITPVDQIE